MSRPSSFYAVAISGNGENFYAYLGSNLYHGVLKNSEVVWSQVYNGNVSYADSITQMQTDYEGKALFISGEFDIDGTTYYGLYSTHATKAPFIGLNSLPNSCNFVTMDNSGTNLVCGIVDVTSTTDSYDMWVSSNKGATFSSSHVYSTTTYGPQSNALAASIYNNNQYVYALGSKNDEGSNVPLLYISKDNGKTYSTYNGSALYLLDLAASGNGEKVFVMTSSALYCISNYGTVWELCYSAFGLGPMAVSGNGAVIYVYEKSNYGVGLYVYSNNTFPPVPAPTMYPTGPTFPPTMYPSYAPTPKASALPFKSTGWFYTNAYMTSSTCSGTPEIVEGLRLGVCTPDDAAYPYEWFMFLCNEQVYQVLTYSNSACSGTPKLVAQYSIQTPLKGYFEFAPTCSQNFCAATASSLPLPVNMVYTVENQYVSYSKGQCSNTGETVGYLNGACIPLNPTYSIYVSYPWITYYDNAKCTGVPTKNVTTDPGCYPNSQVVSTSVTLVAGASAPSPHSAPLSTFASEIKDEVKLWPRLSKRLTARKVNAGRKLITDDGDDDYFWSYSYPGYSFSKVVTDPSDPVSPTSSSSSSGSNTLSAGAIAGITIGSVAVVALITFALISTGILGKKSMVLGSNAVELSNNPTTSNPMYGNKV
jgi:hypothetical protein